MENISLVINDVIKISSDLYRVIKTTDNEIWVVMLNTSKLIIKALSYNTLDHLQEDNVFDFVSAYENKTFSFDDLSEAVKNIATNSYQIVRKLLSFGDISWIASRAKGDKMKELARTNHISIMTLYNWLRRYFQNGQTIDAMIPSYNKCGGKGKERTYTSKRPGRQGSSSVVINDTVISQFKSMINRNKNLHGKESLAGSFSILNRMFYSSDKNALTEEAMGMFPAEKRPTLRQFYYYCKKHFTKADKYESQYGKTAAFNNNRPLLSDSLRNNECAGASFEIDALDIDYKIFARHDSEQPVGTADLVAIVDVNTSAIIGFAVQLACNRTSTVQEALLNMLEDKHDFGNQIGYPIDKSQWSMSGYLPDTLITDNGADYLSNDLLNIIAETGITLSHVPAKMGSYKGTIERLFGQFYQQNAGLILGGRSKDNNQRKDMCTHHLTIEDLRMIVIEFILYHNSHILSDRKRANRILNKQIEEITPNNLWNYDLANDNMLKRVSKFNRFKLALMSSGTGRITRRGIEFDNRCYCIEDMSALFSIMRNAKFDKPREIKIKHCLYSVNTIYFSDGKRYIPAYLNPAKTENDVFFNLSYDTAKEIDKILYAHRRHAAEKNLVKRAVYSSRINHIVKYRKGSNRYKKAEIKHYRRIEDEAFQTETQNRLQQSIISDFEGKENTNITNSQLDNDSIINDMINEFKKNV